VSTETAQPVPQKPPLKYPKRPYTLGQSVVSAGVPPDLQADVRRFATDNHMSVSDVVRLGLDRVLAPDDALVLSGVTGDREATAVLSDDNDERGGGNDPP
jgi:hypothetical protein